jgi:hypothetical protein
MYQLAALLCAELLQHLDNILAGSMSFLQRRDANATAITRFDITLGTSVANAARDRYHSLGQEVTVEVRPGLAGPYPSQRQNWRGYLSLEPPVLEE